MSSILDALQKLESRRQQASGPEPPPRARRSMTPLLIGAALAAFAAGIGISAVWLRPAPAPEAAPAGTGAQASVAPAPAAAPASPPATAPPAAASPPATTPPPSPPGGRPAEQPWAEVVVPAAPRKTPATAAVAAASHEPEPQPPPPGELPEMAVLAPPAPEPPVPAKRSTRPAGAPSVRVSFLVYSSAPERRTVALTIDDGGLVTLHEGESASGVSVGRILPDGVELTWQGQAFTVPARE